MAWVAVVHLRTLWRVTGHCAVVFELAGHGAAVGRADHLLAHREARGLQPLIDQLRSLIHQIESATGTVELPELELGGAPLDQERARALSKMFVLACGTSWHAGLVGEYMIEDLARISVEVEYASEFRYRSPIIEPGKL